VDNKLNEFQREHISRINIQSNMDYMKNKIAFKEKAYLLSVYPLKKKIENLIVEAFSGFVKQIH
jgi:hypothetical protein